MLITCKCLNILLNVNADNKHILNNCYKLFDINLDEVNVNKFTKFTSDHFQFFNEAIGPLNDVDVNIEQIDLIQIGKYSSWSIKRCINCNTITYAINNLNNNYIVNSALLTNQEEINKKKLSDSYSKTFNILLNDKIINFNFYGNNKNVLMPRIKNLSTNLHEIIQKETTNTNERIRLYTEEQYNLLKNYREKVEQEFQLLVSLIYGVPDKIIYDNDSSLILNNSKDNKLTNIDTPPTTPDSTPIDIGDSPTYLLTNDVNPNRNLNKEEKKPQFKNNNGNILHQNDDNKMITNNYPDADCLFDLDGLIDDNNYNYKNTIKKSPIIQHQISEDVDESDYDDDLIGQIKGVVIPRQLGRQSSLSIARSLPITVPNVIDRNEDDFEEMTEDNIDIAATIKALAKSVHGDTVFGDLPTPRFSTQI